MSTKEVKVVLCGGSGTGKSGLIMRLITNKFLDGYDPTIEDSYNKILSVDNQEILLDILDTAGQEQFASMQQFWFREGEIFLIVYSITSRKSFDQIRHFVRKIADAKEFNLSETNSGRTTESNHSMPSKPFIIVGNKCDLDDKREVPTEDAKALADKWGVPFFECSTYTEENLDAMWIESVRLHLRVLSENNNHDKRGANATNKDKKDKSDKSNKGGLSCCNNGGDQEKATDKVQFFAVKKLPPDIVQHPVLALKNFRIKRTFNFKRFLIAILCGLFLPIVIIFQTIAFLIYNENKEPWYFPEVYEYDSVHHSILLDILGLIVGRQPGQDPETVKDRKWFLRQNTKQKVVRVILCLLVAFAFTILYFNVSQFDNKNVSNQETVAPLFLFWSLWLLLSSWIAFKPEIAPALPPLITSRLRAITLVFGEYFTHRTSAYKFLRAYAEAREENNPLSAVQYITIIVLAGLFALIPGITRITVGDDADDIEEKVFWTEENWMIEIGAFLVNFLLVGIFIFAIEVQYSKHFGSYKYWMRDLTLLLSKEQLDYEDAINRRKGTMRSMQEMQELIAAEKSHNLLPSQFGRDFSRHLFLSLTRRSNALGWLEIRSFLAIEGKILFGNQELPTLFLMIATLTLSFWILFRVYAPAIFVNFGASINSIVFNGSVVLMIICLVSLIRIAVTGYQFKDLQETQERLLGEQKLWMRCNVAQNIGVETMDVKEAAFQVMEYAKSYEDETTQQMSAHSEHKEEEQENGQEVKYDNDNDNDNNDVEVGNNTESKPLIQRTSVKYDNSEVLSRVDTSNWYMYNFGFLDDMLFIVRKKDIYPRLFKIKLNSVLAKAIFTVLFSSAITLFKVFVG